MGTRSRLGKAEAAASVGQLAYAARQPLNMQGRLGVPDRSSGSSAWQPRRGHPPSRRAAWPRPAQQAEQRLAARSGSPSQTCRKAVLMLSALACHAVLMLSCMHAWMNACMHACMHAVLHLQAIGRLGSAGRRDRQLCLLVDAFAHILN
eukprot:264196-Chlamydomonas_euryale.AAC.1